jgi:hypothetical protein
MFLVREEPKDLDLVQIGGPTTYWPVRREEDGMPVAAFNSEHSALTYCLRVWAQEER